MPGNTEVIKKFYTPQNESFYSSSPYQPLDPRRRQIRVIRVFPPATVHEHFNNHPQWDPSRAASLDPELEILACQIETTTLASIAGNFTAISYTAGDLSNTKPILVNGIPFNAFANLEHAIACTLGYWERTNNIKPTSSYKLWVDQICINQSDKKELGEQVQFMREIYRQTEQTAVCLSTPQIIDCLSWVPRIYDIDRWQGGESPSVAALKRLLLDLVNRTGECGDLRLSPPLLSTRAKSHSQRTETTHGISPPALTVNGGSYRCWVYQEFISGSSVQFISGSMSASWAEMASLINFVCDDLGHFLDQIQKKLRVDAIDRMVKQESKRRDELEEAWLKPVREARKCENEYYQALDVFHKAQERQWDAASQMQSKQRDKFECEQVQKVYTELQDVERRINTLKTIVNPRKRRDLQREKAKLENFLAHVQRPIQHQIKVAWSFEKDNISEQDVKSDRECGGLIFAPERIKALINLDQVAESWADFKPIGLEQPLPPPQIKPPPKPNLIFPQTRKLTTEWFSADHSGLDVTLKQVQNLGTSQGQSGTILALIPIVVQLSNGYYSITWCRWITYEDVDGTPYNDDRPQGSREPGDIKACGALESTPPSALDSIDMSQAERFEAFAFFYLDFLRIDKSAVRSMINGKQTFERSSDLKTLLRHSRNCQSSDPRDRVYAFLGLAHQGYNIIPNYEVHNGIREVLIETAKSIIRFEKSLDILQHVHRGRDNLGTQLPSWVPDWTSKETLIAPDKKSEEEAQRFDASKGLPMDVEFGSATGDNDYQDLKVRGVCFSRVAEVSSEPLMTSGLSHSQTTECQFIGKAAIPACLDDEIWILFGCRKPVLLRQSGSNCRAYLSDVTIYDRDRNLSNVMLGEIADQVKKGTLGERKEELYDAAA
ncbi:hypothetical protein NPX13_g10137 [Xylaria arbuscula]|uniref:Heterokaryon incompatibility domain-containing protein n=1 Tax=Xylaria arbuscula TaxID=114810 RepID=A0A9W8N539_9PEZI|nr:hypothetical protein NPX13_g10137 [Xylaria arbuscula]